MIKQRYIRHEAINKDGTVESTGYEVAGYIYPFAGKDVGCMHNIQSTNEFIMTYCAVDSASWLAAHKRRFKVTKAIVFVG